MPVCYVIEKEEQGVNMASQRRTFSIAGKRFFPERNTANHMYKRESKYAQSGMILPCLNDGPLRTDLSQN